MEMLTQCANSMRDITNFINEQKLTKDQILNIMQLNDGTIVLNYFV